MKNKWLFKKLGIRSGAASMVAIMIILTIASSTAYLVSKGIGDESEDTGKKVQNIMDGDSDYTGPEPGEASPVEEPDIIVPTAGENVDALTEGYVFNAATQTITGYSGVNKSIVIPKSFNVNGVEVEVLHIGASAFKNKGLTGVVLSSNLKTIGSEAFYGNIFTGGVILDANLTSAGTYYNTSAFYNSSIGDKLSISKNVTAIPANIFSYSKLSQLNLPSSVVSVGSHAFSYNHLTEAKLPAHITSWGSSVYSNNLIGKVEIPLHMTSIPASFFSYNKINDLVIPSHVKVLGSECFSGNPFDIRLVLDSNLTTAGTYYNTSPFYNSSIGDKLTITSNVTAIPANTFAYGGITVLDLPSSVTTVGSSAFRSNQIVAAPLPETVTSWGSAVYMNNYVAEVVIPSYITQIPSSFFSGNRINKLTIPSHVTILGDECFAGNPFDIELVLNSNLTMAGNYYNAAPFYNSSIGDKLTITSNVTKLPANIFSNGGLTTLNLPSSVTSVGSNAFRRNYLTEAPLPETVTSWGTSVYMDNRIATVVIPSYITSIPSYFFSGNAINTLTIPSHVTVLGNECFAGNPFDIGLVLDSNLTTAGTYYNSSPFYNSSIGDKLTITSRVTAIPANTFSYGGLTVLNIPSTVTTVGSNAFRTNKLTQAPLPTTVTSWGSFVYADNLITSVSIPGSITSIPTSFFSGNRITTLTIPSHVTDLGSESFNGNPLSGGVTINANLNSAGYAYNASAFYNATITGPVTFGSNVNKIPANMFGSARISSIVIPSQITSIGSGAFRGSTLTSVTIQNAQANVTIGASAFPVTPVFVP